MDGFAFLLSVTNTLWEYYAHTNARISLTFDQLFDTHLLSLFLHNKHIMHITFSNVISSFENSVDSDQLASDEAS